jgi:ABC-type uncharacterized transport system substrate-binding protein
VNKTIPTVAVAMLVAASVSLAQAQDGKAHRVGVLSIVDTPVLKGFRDGLKETGYVEGKNLVLDIPVKKTYDESGEEVNPVRFVSGRATDFTNPDATGSAAYRKTIGISLVVSLAMLVAVPPRVTMTSTFCSL